MKKIISLGFTCILLANCTLLESRYQYVTVSSIPPQASIAIDGNKTKYITPAKIKLKKGKTKILNISKDGYYDAVVKFYDSRRRSDKLKYCKWDLYFGWFLLGIPVMYAKDNIRCHLFHKSEANVELTPIKTNSQANAEGNDAQGN